MTPEGVIVRQCRCKDVERGRPWLKSPVTILDTSSCLLIYSIYDKLRLKTRLGILRLKEFAPLCLIFCIVFHKLVPLFQAMERDKVNAFHEQGFVSRSIRAADNIHLLLDLMMTRTISNRMLR